MGPEQEEQAREKHRDIEDRDQIASEPRHTEAEGREKNVEYIIPILHKAEQVPEAPNQVEEGNRMAKIACCQIAVKR